jgi:hypothetical protein
MRGNENKYKSTNSSTIPMHFKELIKLNKSSGCSHLAPVCHVIVEQEKYESNGNDLFDQMSMSICSPHIKSKASSGHNVSTLYELYYLQRKTRRQEYIQKSVTL